MIRERTHDQHVVLNTWAQYGDAFFVSKVGRRWVVTVNGHRVPMAFKTKKAALAQAYLSVRAFVEPREDAAP